MKTLPTTTIAIPAGQINERIVAEVTCTWRHGEIASLPKEMISHQFEKVIAFNQSRGYELESWNLTSILDPLSDEPGISETIVAVFKRSPEHKAINQ